MKSISDFKKNKFRGVYELSLMASVSLSLILGYMLIVMGVFSIKVIIITLLSVIVSIGLRRLLNKEETQLNAINGKGLE